MAVYAAMVEAIDTSVGTLVEGSPGAGRVRQHADPVYVATTAATPRPARTGDLNGDGPPGGPNSNVFLGMNWATLANTPFRRYKHFTHEGGIATPLIAHWPAGIPRNRRKLEHQPGHLIDVMATVAEMTGATYPREFKGHADPTDGRGEPAAGIRRTPARSDAADLLGARRQPGGAHGNWKLVSSYQGDWELYDMTADRVERNNLAARHPDLVRRLAGEWDAWAKRTNVDPWNGPRRLPWGDDAPVGK